MTNLNLIREWREAREVYVRSYVLKYYLPHLYKHLKFYILNKFYKIFEYKHKHSFNLSLLFCNVCHKSMVTIDHERLGYD